MQKQQETLYGMAFNIQWRSFRLQFHWHIGMTVLKF